MHVAAAVLDMSQNAFSPSTPRARIMVASQPCGLAAPLEQTGTGDVRGLENAALEELQQMLLLAKKRVRFLEAAIAARAAECAHEWRVCFLAGP